MPTLHPHHTQINSHLIPLQHPSYSRQPTYYTTTQKQHTDINTTRSNKKTTSPQDTQHRLNLMQ